MRSIIIGQARLIAGDEIASAVACHDTVVDSILEFVKICPVAGNIDEVEIAVVVILNGRIALIDGIIDQIAVLLFHQKFVVPYPYRQIVFRRSTR